HLGAVVELDALAHLERVGETVGRDRMALGHPWLEHRRVPLPAHEAVINVEADGNATDVERGVGVDGVVVAYLGKHEAARRRRGMSEMTCLGKRACPTIQVWRSATRRRNSEGSMARVQMTLQYAAGALAPA